MLTNHNMAAFHGIRQKPRKEDQAAPRYKSHDDLDGEQSAECAAPAQRHLRQVTHQQGGQPKFADHLGLTLR